MSATEGINETNKLFMDAFADGDAEKVAGFYTANCRFLPDNSHPVDGRANVQELLQSMMDGGVSSIELITCEVEDCGDTAVEVGRVVMRGGDDEILDDGKFIVIWKKEDDGWRLHRDIVNSSLPSS
ncbi:MAG: nuclear transport factor 2 family protein [Pseudomonadota bacterium]|nr:nuclear transport factor 2 family protein [Pseudomonadota bacterium]